jgi:hypothetical protein
MIGPSQRPLTALNIQKRQNIHAPGGIRSRNFSKEQPHTYALERVDTGIDAEKSLPVNRDIM